MSDFRDKRLRESGVRPVSFEPVALPCGGHDDKRCLDALCDGCAHFSTAPTLGPVRQAPAHALDLLGKTWFCVDFEAVTHGDATVGQQVETRKSVERGGVCPTSSADWGLAP